MSEYTLAVYVWSAIGLSGLLAPLAALAVRQTAKATDLPLPCAPSTH